MEDDKGVPPMPSEEELNDIALDIGPESEARFMANCEDSAGEQQCRWWAYQGYCNGQYRNYMTTNCRKSCRSCASAPTPSPVGGGAGASTPSPAGGAGGGGGAYQYVQQIGLQLDTNHERVGGRSSYVGVTKMENGRNVADNVQDAIKRVEVMKAMMNVAYNSAHWERSSQVLKIFMAPEFFFRGANGAYDIEKLADCTDPNKGCAAPIVRIVELLHQEVQQTKWKDWMFVFGTIVAHSIKEGEYFNFAPVMRGGPDGTKKRHIIAKTYISGIDFIKRRDLLVETGSQVALPTRGHFYAAFSELEKKTLANEGFTIDDADDVFMMDGIRFGVEVCLDHLQGVLKKQSTGPVQVHLVTSAGMKIHTNKGVVYDSRSNSYCGPMLLQDSGTYGGTSYYCPGCSSSSGSSANRNVNTVKYTAIPRGSGYKQENTRSVNTGLLYAVFDDGRLSREPPVINFAPSFKLNTASSCLR
jgi:hypothetical protein